MISCHINFQNLAKQIQYVPVLVILNLTVNPLVIETWRFIFFFVHLSVYYINALILSTWELFRRTWKFFVFFRCPRRLWRYGQSNYCCYVRLFAIGAFHLHSSFPIRWSRDVIIFDLLCNITLPVTKILVVRTVLKLHWCQFGNRYPRRIFDAMELHILPHKSLTYHAFFWL